MKFFGLTLLINAVLYFLVKAGILEGIAGTVLYFAALVCWLLGALSLDRAWKQEKISHNLLMILTHASLLFAASMPY